MKLRYDELLSNCTSNFNLRRYNVVVTTRDLGALLRRAGIHPGDLQDSEFDSPLGKGSGAGMLFGVTGGVMEAAVRTVYAVVTEAGAYISSLESSASQLNQSRFSGPYTSSRGNYGRIRSISIDT